MPGFDLDADLLCYGVALEANFVVATALARQSS